MKTKEFFKRCFNKCINSDPEQQVHKTFYYYFRPIAFICRLIGVIPLKNLQDCKSLEFHYFSMPTLYSTLLFCGCVVTFFVLNGRAMLDVLETDGTQRFWINTLMLMLAIRSFVCCYFCASRSSKFIKLIRSLDLFDARKFEYFKSGLNVRRNIFTCTMRPIMIGLAITLTFNSNLWQLSRNSTPISNSLAVSNIIFSFIGIWHVIPLLLYNYFARTIACNLKCISKVITNVIPSKNWCQSANRREPICSLCNIKEVLRNVRVLHLLASDSVQHLSNSFGSFLAVDQLYVIVMFVMDIYVICFTDIDQYSFIYCAIIDGIIVLGVIYVSHDVTDKVRHQWVIIFLVILFNSFETVKTLFLRRIRICTIMKFM